MISGIIAKFAPLLETPDTVTTTLPLTAPLGTGTTMLFALQLDGVAVTAPNVTVLVPGEEPKFAPVIVTGVPTTPANGDRPAIPGPDPTTKRALLLTIPSLVTVTNPVVAPAGTGTTMLVAFQLVGTAAMPLKLTLLLPCAEPKFWPVMVTEVPVEPEAGLRLVITTAGPN